ncbi:MAG: DNA replication/repair protein RecF, partial [Chitinophagales bacterium]
VGFIPVVMITPDDQLLIDEGSDERRRFVDNAISQIDHAYLEFLIEYNKVMAQRNAALKRFAEKRSTDHALIESYDQQLAASGVKIFEARKKYFGAMIPVIGNFYALLSEQAEEVTASYESVCSSESLLDSFRRSFEKDCATQRTNEGIHRDDFDFFLNGRSLKKFGSQGQKKSFLMALKFAQYELIRREKNQRPILLLDDLFDKLDERRAQNIFRLMNENGFGQVFITDTHEERVLNLLAQSEDSTTHYKISGGKVVNTFESTAE